MKDPTRVVSKFCGNIIVNMNSIEDSDVEEITEVIGRMTLGDIMYIFTSIPRKYWSLNFVDLLNEEGKFDTILDEAFASIGAKESTGKEES